MRRQALPRFITGAKTAWARGAPSLRTARSSHNSRTTTSAAALRSVTTMTTLTTPLDGIAARIHQPQPRNGFGCFHSWHGPTSFVTPGTIVASSTPPAKLVPLLWSTRRSLNINSALSSSQQQQAFPLSFRIAAFSTSANTPPSLNPLEKYREDCWKAKFELLQQYKEEHGDCNIKYSYTTNDGVKLGHWVSTQRQQYKKLQEGQPSPITQERIEKLESIGISWVPLGAKENNDKWNAKFELLKQYVKDHGDCLLPSRYTTADGVKLGQWISRQRSEHKKLQEGQQSSMTQERIERLESIGFSWVSLGAKQNTDKWNAKFELLQQYKEEHGDCLVPSKYTTTDGVNLGRWVDAQKQQYRMLQEGKQSAMTQERIEKLESIGVF